jgi:hypothetical protein
MPTVLCYVLCLTFVSGFESHSLRQLIENKQVKVILEIHQAPLTALVLSLE